MAAIQRHAMRLFREKGYQATTVEQIAEAAEVSPSTFFRYFPTKEDVVVRDDYDPLLIEAFEGQPPDLSPFQALRNAMQAGLREIAPDELTTLLRERNRLILTVPELRAAMMSNLSDTMLLLARLVARRVGRAEDDLAVQTFAGAFVGAIFAVMNLHATDPEADFGDLLDRALSHLEAGLPL
ncbi:TetR family transcriptional regulator [Cohnella nanjingensis]|uniref:TetR family transcriptional regulator n=2 Tax=Cohnella nanjingensis TaxID=1387779 RepID=A0A7X0RR79_9BACL|nr:TetR family transcriptional regulator [Cohnella nanjingensis]